MKRMVAGFVALVLLIAMALTGCAGGGGGEKMSVDLKEWSVTPAATTLKSGKLTFEAKNTGTIHHELRVMRLGGATPQLVGLIETFDPGQTRSKEFVLTPGRYELSCQIVDPQPGGGLLNHYELGMHTAVTVE